ncbi:MAG: hypothetical protein KBD64_04700 [Gammaproteobacteria bacterium]|nr:hypothetical protein [Gammaproteobacteria bacterium]
MQDEPNQALKAYMNLVDASSKGPELTQKITQKIDECMNRLNDFLNLNDQKRPAIIESYKPESFEIKNIAGSK